MESRLVYQKILLYILILLNLFSFKCIKQSLESSNRCPKCNYLIESPDQIFPNFSCEYIFSLLSSILVSMLLVFFVSCASLCSQDILWYTGVCLSICLSFHSVFTFSTIHVAQNLLQSIFFFFKLL